MRRRLFGEICQSVHISVIRVFHISNVLFYFLQCTRVQPKLINTYCKNIVRVVNCATKHSIANSHGEKQCVAGFWLLISSTAGGNMVISSDDILELQYSPVFSRLLLAIMSC